MYEVEIKVELNSSQKNSLLESLKLHNFNFVKSTPQNDYYVEAKESQYRNLGGSYDLKRYRQEGDEFIYTEKWWELVSDHIVRGEKENSISKDEFDKAVMDYPNALKIIKNRDWYHGEYQGREISFTLDTVKFNHSDSERYFIEAEIGVEDKNDVRETEDFLRDFLKVLLTVDEIKSSPGMFSMAYHKL